MLVVVLARPQVAEIIPLRYVAWLLSPTHAHPRFLVPLFGLLRRLFADVPAAVKPFVEARGMQALAHHAEAALVCALGLACFCVPLVRC